MKNRANGRAIFPRHACKVDCSTRDLSGLQGASVHDRLLKIRNRPKKTRFRKSGGFLQQPDDTTASFFYFAGKQAVQFFD
jgi:hypothetical protein